VDADSCGGRGLISRYLGIGWGDSVTVGDGGAVVQFCACSKLRQTSLAGQTAGAESINGAGVRPYG
jgi:hypothetical protein